MAKGKLQRKKTPRSILVIDVGGSHVKFVLSPKSEKREFKSSSRLSADSMVARVKRMTKDWSYDAVSIGFPGVVVRDRPVAEPKNLGRGWIGFDFEEAFGCPTKVINDAALQALGSYAGGRMLFLGLGTGLGAAMIIDDVIEPMELAHLPYRKGKTFEHYVGAGGLKRFGRKKWQSRVLDTIKTFTVALQPEYVVLGGGNAEKIKKLPPRTRRAGNAKAFEGGFRLWQMQHSRRS